MQISTFVDGKLAERWGSSDELGILTRLGLAPGAEPAGLRRVPGLMCNPHLGAPASELTYSPLLTPKAWSTLQINTRMTVVLPSRPGA